jgi:hypothetical protein
VRGFEAFDLILQELALGGAGLVPDRDDAARVALAATGEQCSGDK